MNLHWRYVIWKSKRAALADECWRFNMLLPPPRICLLLWLAFLVTTGCAIRKPVQKMYCNQMSADGKHCLVWAAHKDLGCVHNQYGDCTAETR